MIFSTSKAKTVILLCIISILVLDLGITAITFVISTRPQKIFQSTISGQKVQVFYSTQGAFGLDQVSVFVGGKKYGTRVVTHNLKTITQVDYFPDSMIVNFIHDGIVDTCVIHKELFVP